MWQVSLKGPGWDQGAQSFTQKSIVKILVWTPNTRIFFLFLGLAALVACSWVGRGIVTDFYNPLMPVTVKDEFGPAIYIGFARSSLVFLGGLLLPGS